ncbi:MAG: hypothetical protein AAF772_11225 [Acidobacteriota bacterium]
MTWSQKLKAEGRGEGRNEGVLIGLLDGKRQTVTHLLDHRFGPLDDDVHRRLDAVVDPEAFDRLVKRALDARSLDEALDVDGVPTRVDG